jgi:methionyl-tRNA synthetase
MEKLGVELDEEKTKTAGKDQQCPKCGRALDPRQEIPKCRVCGTEPWEKVPKQP